MSSSFDSGIAGSGAIAPPPPVIIVTGMSGAGRSSALKALEDLGYEAVDNLPRALLPNILNGSSGAARPLALGVDVRTRDFDPKLFIKELDKLKQINDFRLRILFLDCASDVLLRRFSETRRRHPVAPDRRVVEGIKLERRILKALCEKADLVIDTTEMSVADLKRQLTIVFALSGPPRLPISVISFSYRHGIPPEADLVFDVRFLRNPHYEKALSNKTGLDKPVGDYIKDDRDFPVYFQNLTTLLIPLLPRFVEEGKSYLTIAIGCTGGKHRSVYLAERLGAWLGDQGEHTNIGHRDIERGR
ncbi:MAG: RNase adapter RapZ [Pseudomonadota bacterium]|nr:RNase adapter RapZ [Pseudomonadota bacterium]